MQIDVQKIAQSLLDELMAEKKQIDSMAVGVNLLYERLRKAIEEADAAGREADSLPGGDAPEAQQESSPK